MAKKAISLVKLPGGKRKNNAFRREERLIVTLLFPCDFICGFPCTKVLVARSSDDCSASPFLQK